MKSTTVIECTQALKSVQIYDISGVLLCEQPCDGEFQVVIHKQSLPQGICFVKSILQNGNIEITKLIIQ
jgi:hypothetical protein